MKQKSIWTHASHLSIKYMIIKKRFNFITCLQDLNVLTDIKVMWSDVSISRSYVRIVVILGFQFQSFHSNGWKDFGEKNFFKIF